MGENPKFIFTVGNSSLDNMLKIPKFSKKRICNDYDLNPKDPYVVVTMHTVTSEIKQIQEYMKNVIDAITELNIQAILIRGNADAGSNKMLQIIKNSKIKRNELEVSLSLRPDIFEGRNSIYESSSLYSKLEIIDIDLKLIHYWDLDDGIDIYILNKNS